MTYSNLKEQILTQSFVLDKRVKLVSSGNRKRFSEISLQSKKFQTSQLKKDILKVTSFLDILEGVNIKHRIKAILQDIHSIRICPICKNPCSFYNENQLSKPLFSITCKSSECILKCASNKGKTFSNATRNKMSKQRLYHKKVALDKINEVVSKYQQADYSIVEEQQIKEFISGKVKLIFGNAPVISEKDFFTNENIICNMLSMTKFIEIPKNISLYTLRMQERAYCIINDIKYKKLCPYCMKSPLRFVSFKHGYSKCCKKTLCQSDHQRKTSSGMTSREIIDRLEKENRYKVLKFPSKNGEFLIIKCLKCGSISKIPVHTGRLQHLDKMHLCKNCDKYVSNGEKQLREFILSLDVGEVAFNDRTAIEPYELDLYLPKQKVAFEFNGIYWHSELSGKKSKYAHLKKTRLCEKSGIMLFNVWEDKWIENEDYVKKQIIEFLKSPQKAIFEQSLRNNEYLVVERAKFNKCLVPDGYQFIRETKPTPVKRKNGNKYTEVYDCGKLIYKKT